MCLHYNLHLFIVALLTCVILTQISSFYVSIGVDWLVIDRLIVLWTYVNAFIDIKFTITTTTTTYICQVYLHCML